MSNIAKNSQKSNLREAMPVTTAFIDALRAAFGADAINPSIKSGINGQPTFYASENGIEVGTKAKKVQA
ncbi:hypothetical protein HQN60_12565 [Deefgea piscis]|uniref:Uncharacterized protein n=1 Tax=Deefgea piscis TaxID=2739061 RepID=A0A6M8SPT2_9NEIS|nr:hypothetical protein [Deefgea piscis]QKJ65246.1 hypothetical protein HQN60_12565 [Deefgea piscis]